jgi:deferrochelatase/peroxidase EfeB
MGHCNAQGEPAPGPKLDPSKLPNPSRSIDATNSLSSDGVPEGFRNLGLDGSYLVMRELRQDVAAFWNSMYAAFGAQTPDDAVWIASRVVGRTMDGHMLIPGGTLPPVAGEPQNAFTFFATDRNGLGCPIGSHVRRANPRDGLAHDANSAPDLLAAAQNHRILRRARKFGKTIVDPRLDDGVERGLLFMCFNTDLVRQFEFVQQTWLLNHNFGTLLDETDPLLGPRGRFTLPAKPLRLRPTVETFVRFAGGEYFFLPSLLALDYLQTLTA